MKCTPKLTFRVGTSYNIKSTLYYRRFINVRQFMRHWCSRSLTILWGVSKLGFTDQAVDYAEKDSDTMLVSFNDIKKKIYG